MTFFTAYKTSNHMYEKKIYYTIGSKYIDIWYCIITMPTKKKRRKETYTPFFKR